MGVLNGPVTGASLSSDVDNVTSDVGNVISSADDVISGAGLQKLSALVHQDRSLVPQIPQIGAIKDFQPDEGKRRKEVGHDRRTDMFLI